MVLDSSTFHLKSECSKQHFPEGNLKSSPPFLRCSWEERSAKARGWARSCVTLKAALRHLSPPADRRRQEIGFSLHRHDISKTHSEGRRIRIAARRDEEAGQGSDALPPSLNPIPRGTELCWFQCLAFSPSPLPFLHLNATVFKSEVRGLLTSLVSYFNDLTSLLTSPCSTSHSTQPMQLSRIQT